MIISTGSDYNEPFKEHGVVAVTRAMNLRRSYEKLSKAERVVIVGGGLVGVELAGEISEKYGREKKIVIIHSGKFLIERNNERAIKYADDYLRKRGVKLIFGEKVVDAKKTRNEIVCKTDKGSLLKSDMVFLCTGITPNYQFMKKNFSSSFNKRYFIKVNNHLQLETYKNIFVIGDVNNRAEEKTAQNAERQAEAACKNIFALESGKELVEYSSEIRPLVISLGRYNGIFSYGKFVFGGKIPAFLKWAVERREMWKKQRFSFFQ